MSKVFVVNKGGHDYSAAERYGQLVFCTDGSMPRYNTNQMYREIERSLKDSTSEDYLLLTSLTVLNVIAAGIFAAKHGRLNLLLYQSKRGRDRQEEYLERKVILTERREHDKPAEKEPKQGNTGGEEEEDRGGSSQGAEGLVGEGESPGNGAGAEGKG